MIFLFSLTTSEFGWEERCYFSFSNSFSWLAFSLSRSLSWVDFSRLISWFWASCILLIFCSFSFINLLLISSIIFVLYADDDSVTLVTVSLGLLKVTFSEEFSLSRALTSFSINLSLFLSSRFSDSRVEVLEMSVEICLLLTYPPSTS